MPNLQSTLYIIKQNLKTKSEKLKYHKKLHQRKTINHELSYDPKSTYLSVKGSSIAAEKIPTKDNV